MIAPNPTNRAMIRLKFFGVYALSIACIAFIISAFFHRQPASPEPVQASAPQQQQAPTVVIQHDTVYNNPAPTIVLQHDTIYTQPAQPVAVVPPPAPVREVNNEEVTELKKTIKEKDRRIAQLAAEAKQQERNSAAIAAKYEEHPAKGESIEALKRSNANLQQGFKDVMNKLWESYRVYNLLKKENEQLHKQLGR